MHELIVSDPCNIIQKKKQSPQTSLQPTQCFLFFTVLFFCDAVCVFKKKKNFQKWYNDLKRLRVEMKNRRGQWLGLVAQQQLCCRFHIPGFR